MNSKVSIDIVNLSRSYTQEHQKITVLQDIDLTIHEGSFTILKGISGSGKTTLLSLMAGLDKPSSGKVLIEGEPISKLPDSFASEVRAKKIGMIFQHFNLFEHLTVEQNITIPLVPSKYSQNDIKTMVDSALNLANIAHKRSTTANNLSGGEKQRTAIARALIAKPNIILCDEPTANLDKDNSLLFIDILSSLVKLGKTIVVATHDPLFDNLPFENRIVPMVDGRVTLA